MKQKTCRIFRHNRIAEIRLQSPDGWNLLSIKAIAELGQAITGVFRDSDIDAVIIAASDRIFCMGADISEITMASPGRGYALSRDGQETLKMIKFGSKVTIAAINGFAMGAGCELAMACSIRIASSRAKFSLPEIKLGVIPGFGGTQYLPRLVGKSRAMELVLTGKLLSASDALKIGLVNQVCAPVELKQRALSEATACIERAILTDRNT